MSVIYAIEEPETSQHPDNQRLLVQALKELAVDENTQVLVTSHTPGLAGLLPNESLRCVRKMTNGTATVSHCSEDDLAVIANELGVLPDRRVQALVFVEGTNDIEFLERISAIIKPDVPDAVDFTNDSRVALVPLGGGSLKQWVGSFVHWYNGEHRHSAIGFVTPEQRHAGLDVELLRKRAAVYEAAKAMHPNRWSGATRNWNPVTIVHLNPEKGPTLNKNMEEERYALKKAA